MLSNKRRRKRAWSKDVEISRDARAGARRREYTWRERAWARGTECTLVSGGEQSQTKRVESGRR